MTCHLIVRPSDVELVVHQTGERLVAATLAARWPRAIPHLAAHPGSVASRT